ncbi:MAG: hypothetical protein E4H02_05275 [Lentisphaerales bacterium]|nr:MAG: hypothetical protein E4H02_05275 [Lentisphaerales bacterium]
MRETKAQNRRGPDAGSQRLRAANTWCSRRGRLLPMLAAVCVFASGVSVAAGGEELRTWTSSRGESIEAALVGADGEMVQLEDRNGQAIAIQRVNLSEDDRAYLDSIGSGESGWQTNEVFIAEVMVSSNEAAWMVQDVFLLTTIRDVDITESYSEPVDKLILTKKPPDGYILVTVDFRLQAMVPESNAVDRLVVLRAAQAEDLPHVGTVLAVDSSEQNALRGRYRFFDMSNDVALVDTNDARYVPTWILLPDTQRGIYLLETGGPQKVFGGTRATKPWRQTCQTNKGFTGLLDVGVPVDVGLIFAVPKGVRLDLLKLQIAGLEPVVVVRK